MVNILFKAFFKVTNRTGTDREVIFGLKINNKPIYAYRFFNVRNGYSVTLDAIDVWMECPGIGDYPCEARTYDSYDPALLANWHDDLVDKNTGEKVGEIYVWFNENWLIDLLDAKTEALEVTYLPTVTMDQFTIEQYS